MRSSRRSAKVGDTLMEGGKFGNTADLSWRRVYLRNASWSLVREELGTDGIPSRLRIVISLGARIDLCSANGR